MVAWFGHFFSPQGSDSDTCFNCSKLKITLKLSGEFVSCGSASEFSLLDDAVSLTSIGDGVVIISDLLDIDEHLDLPFAAVGGTRLYFNFLLVPEVPLDLVDFPDAPDLPDGCPAGQSGTSHSPDAPDSPDAPERTGEP